MTLSILAIQCLRAVGRSSVRIRLKPSRSLDELLAAELQRDGIDSMADAERKKERANAGLAAIQALFDSWTLSPPFLRKGMSRPRRSRSDHCRCEEQVLHRFRSSLFWKKERGLTFMWPAFSAHFPRWMQEDRAPGDSPGHALHPQDQ